MAARDNYTLTEIIYFRGDPVKDEKILNHEITGALLRLHQRMKEIKQPFVFIQPPPFVQANTDYKTERHLYYDPPYFQLMWVTIYKMTVPGGFEMEFSTDYQDLRTGITKPEIHGPQP